MWLEVGGYTNHLHIQGRHAWTSHKSVNPATISVSHHVIGQRQILELSINSDNGSTAREEKDEEIYYVHTIHITAQGGKLS